MLHHVAVPVLSCAIDRDTAAGGDGPADPFRSRSVLLRSNARRPAKEVPPMPEPPPPPPTRRAEPIWLQPYPDILLEGLPDTAPGPAARYKTKEATALAFIAGLQRLPSLQRTALVLRDVLSFSAGESATMLETTASTSRTGTPGSRGRGVSSCSHSTANRSRRSPSSATRASSRTSDCHARSSRAPST
jgi:hypothetical protein